MQFIEALIGLAMWVGIFLWIRNMHRKHKAKKLERNKQLAAQRQADEQKAKAEQAERDKEAKEHQAMLDDIHRKEAARAHKADESAKQEFIEEHPGIDFDEAFKHGIQTDGVYMQSDVVQNNKVHHLEKISKNRAGQVFFPESERKYELYYLTDVMFTQEYDTEQHIIKGQKGKAAKRGHYVRNTLLFGLVGTALTHDKPGIAATSDQVYQTKQPVLSQGYLKLVTIDFKETYTVPFLAYQAKADELRGMYMTSPDRIRYLEEQLNK